MSRFKRRSADISVGIVEYLCGIYTYNDALHPDFDVGIASPIELRLSTAASGEQQCKQEVKWRVADVCYTRFCIVWLLSRPATVPVLPVHWKVFWWITLYRQIYILFLLVIFLVQCKKCLLSIEKAGQQHITVLSWIGFSSEQQDQGSFTSRDPFNAHYDAKNNKTHASAFSSAVCS